MPKGDLEKQDNCLQRSSVRMVVLLMEERGKLRLYVFSEKRVDTMPDSVKNKQIPKVVSMQCFVEGWKQVTKG